MGMTCCLALGLFLGVLQAAPNVPALRRAMMTGEEFLSKQISPAGKIGGASYRQRDGGTEALAALALYRSGARPEKSTTLKRLLDGLSGHTSENPAARATTTILWAEANRPQDLKKDLDWLVEHQGTDGGWGPDSKKSSNIVDTAFVLLALQAAAQEGRGIPDGVWTDARKFLQACRNSWGGFGYQAVDAKPFRFQGTSNGLATAAATTAAAVLYQATGQPADRKALQHGQVWLGRSAGKMTGIPGWAWGNPPLMTYLFSSRRRPRPVRRFNWAS